MTNRKKIGQLLPFFGLAAGLVLLQQSIEGIVFGDRFDWVSVLRFAPSNIGIVAFWLYFKNPASKLPHFLVAFVSLCLALSLRVFLFQLGLFRLICPIIVSFFEKQIGALLYIMAAPQFIPTALAAVILLMLMRRVKTVYRRIITN